MSNDMEARLFRMFASIGKMVIDGKRNPELVANYLQRIIDPSLRLIPAVPISEIPLRKDGRTVPADIFVGLIATNVNNSKMTDEDFREFLRKNLPLVVYYGCETKN